MKDKANRKVRDESLKNHVPLWMVADYYGKSYSWIIQKLRHELSAAEQLEMVNAIQEISERRGKEYE